MSEPITLSYSELSNIVAIATERAVEALKQELSVRLPRMYKFPEDIFEMLGGYVPENTIRSWKTSGYLQTTPIGARSYVSHDQWRWFLANHKELMSRAKRTRGAAYNGRSQQNRSNEI